MRDVRQEGPKRRHDSVGHHTSRRPLETARAKRIRSAAVTIRYRDRASCLFMSTREIPILRNSTVDPMQPSAGMHKTKSTSLHVLFVALRAASVDRRGGPTRRSKPLRH